MVFVGGPGSGKSHLATAIGMNAVRSGKSVRFWSVVDLVNQLEAEKRSPPTGRSASIAERLTHRDAVILDELGYLPFSPDGAALLFHLMPALRAHLAHRDDQSLLQRVGRHLRRRQDDHGAPGPAYSSLRHRGNRQRELPLQEPKLGAQALVRIGRRKVVRIARRLTPARNSLRDMVELGRIQPPVKRTLADQVSCFCWESEQGHYNISDWIEKAALRVGR